jgi:hypothetical protein
MCVSPNSYFLALITKDSPSILKSKKDITNVTEKENQKQMNDAAAETGHQTTKIHSTIGGLARFVLQPIPSLSGPMSTFRGCARYFGSLSALLSWVAGA